MLHLPVLPDAERRHPVGIDDASVLVSALALDVQVNRITVKGLYGAKALRVVTRPETAEAVGADDLPVRRQDLQHRREFVFVVGDLDHPGAPVVRTLGRIQRIELGRVVVFGVALCRKEAAGEDDGGHDGGQGDEVVLRFHETVLMVCGTKMASFFFCCNPFSSYVIK